MKSVTWFAPVAWRVALPWVVAAGTAGLVGSVLDPAVGEAVSPRLQNASLSINAAWAGLGLPALWLVGLARFRAVLTGLLAVSTTGLRCLYTRVGRASGRLVFPAFPLTNWGWQRMRARSETQLALTTPGQDNQITRILLLRAWALVGGLALALQAGLGLQAHLEPWVRATQIESITPVLGASGGALLGLLLAWTMVRLPALLASLQMAGRLDGLAVRHSQRVLADAMVWLLALGLVQLLVTALDLSFVGNKLSEGVSIERAASWVLISGVAALAYGAVRLALGRAARPATQGLWIVLLDGEPQPEGRQGARSADGSKGRQSRADWVGQPLDLPARLGLIDRLATGWAPGPVTVVAPPSLRMGGEHLLAADALGRGAALFPKIAVALQDWLRTLPPLARWAALPLRELYPERSLMLHAVQTLARPEDVVLLLAQDETPLAEWRLGLGARRCLLGWQGAAVEETAGLAGLPHEHLVALDLAHDALLDSYAAGLLQSLGSQQVVERKMAAEQALSQAMARPAQPQPGQPVPATEVADDGATADGNSQPTLAPKAQGEPTEASVVAPEVLPAEAAGLDTSLPPQAEDEAKPVVDEGAAEKPPSDPEGAGHAEGAPATQTPEPDSGLPWTLSVDHDLIAHRGRILHIAISPDGRRFLSTSRDRSVKLWPLDDAQLRPASATELRGHEGAVAHAVFSADGQLILSGSDDRTARLWNAEGEMAKMTGHSSEVTSVAFNPDGKHLLSGSNDRTVRLLGLTSSVVWAAGVLQGHGSAIARALFSPDGSLILTASHDHTARLWTLEGERVKVLQGHTDAVTRASFSPDGRWVLTGSRDGDACVWSREGERVAELHHHAPIAAAEFCPDGQAVLAASVDGLVQIASLAGDVLSTWREDGDNTHSQAIRHAAFSPDGQCVLTATDTRISLWSREGRLLGRIAARGAPTALAWDGERIIYGNKDGRLKLLRVQAGGAEPA